MTKNLKLQKRQMVQKQLMYFFNQEVDEIRKIGDKFKVTTQMELFYTADFVVVKWRIYRTLYLASQMGHENIRGGSLSVWLDRLYYKWNIFNGKVYGLK